jgi:nitrate reductase NapE component
MDALLYLSAVCIWTAIAAVALGGGFLFLCWAALDETLCGGGPR